MIQLRQKLIDKGITPSISKRTIDVGMPGSSVEIECVVLSVQFYDELTGQAGAALESACAVTEFYAYQTRCQAELTKATQVITWIESH
jgi:hypothetical protein